MIQQWQRLSLLIAFSMMSVHAYMWCDDNALDKLQRKKKENKKKHPPDWKKANWEL